MRHSGLRRLVAADRPAPGDGGRLSRRTCAARRRGDGTARLAWRVRHRLPPVLPRVARRLDRQGTRRVRGSPLLRPLGRERAERSACVRTERYVSPARLWRIHDHDAGDAAHPAASAHARLEVRGGVPCDADRTCARQDVDRVPVPKPRAVRVEPRGRGGGGERLVRQAREGPRHRGGGASRRHGAVSLAVPPGPPSRPRAEAARVRAGADARARHDRREPARRRPGRHAGDTARSASVQRAVLLRLGAAARRARGNLAGRRADDAGRRHAGA